MNGLDTGISLPNPRTSSRVQNPDRRRGVNHENSRGRGSVGSGDCNVAVEVKDDEDEVQIISPSSVAQMRLTKRTRHLATSHLATSDSADHLDLELTLGSPGMASQKPSRMAPRSGVIDLTTENDDDVVLLPARKRKTSTGHPEPSKDVQLTCAICMDTMKEETSTVCGHIFCRPCILQAVKTQRKCPTCRRKLVNSNIHRIYLSSGSR